VHEFSKPGFFYSEARHIQRIREVTGTGAARHPITYLVEAADDLVYCSVDLEDGVKKGLLDWHIVRAELRQYSNNDRLLISILEELDKHVPKDEHDADILAQSFRIWFLAYLVPEIVQIFEARYQDIMNGTYHHQLAFDPDCPAAPVLKAAKRILHDRLYTAPEVLSLEIRGRKVIHELMDLFWEGIESYDGSPVTTRTYPGKLYLLLSKNYRDSFESRWGTCTDDSERQYFKLQLLTDHICGMTDSYACRIHRELTNG